MLLGSTAMFCPMCGTLAFPSPSGEISCSNYKCGYKGPTNAFIISQGKQVDLSRAKSTKHSDDREYSIARSSNVPKMVTFGHCEFCNQETTLHITTQTLYGADDDISKTYAKCTHCGGEFERL